MSSFMGNGGRSEMHVVLEAQAWFNKSISREANISINRQSGEQHSVEAEIGGTALASRKRLCYLQRERCRLLPPFRLPTNRWGPLNGAETDISLPGKCKWNVPYDTQERFILFILLSFSGWFLHGWLLVCGAVIVLYCWAITSNNAHLKSCFYWLHLEDMLVR